MARYDISSGQSSNGIILNNEYMTIYSGGTATLTTVNSGAIEIDFGGVANDTMLNSWGGVFIESGGTANNTMINSGYMIISSGGEANNTTINSLYVNVWGGVANHNIVNSDAFLAIYSGGTANDTTVNDGGSMAVDAEGIANNTTVKFGGSMFISSGGTHKGILQIENGAIVSAYEGSIIDFTVAERTVEDDYLINNLSLITGTPTYTITVSAEQEYGTYKLAQGASLFTGSITIGDGTINYGSITVNGEDFVYNNTIYSLDQANGNLTLSITKIPSIFIYSSGILTSSGTVIDGAELISGGNNIMRISSGGTANSTTVNYYGDMYISSGGVANRTTVNSRGYMYIHSGGTASCTLMSGGDMRIYDSGTAESTIVNSGGRMYISSGGTANSTIVNSGGRMFVFSSGTAMKIVENGGYVEVADGADVTFEANILNDLILCDTYMTVHSNTIANNITVDSYGWMYIYNGGIANNASVNSDGWMYIYDGGIANNATVDSYGRMHIFSGGVVNNTIVNSLGRLDVDCDGSASDTVVNSAGRMYIDSGAVAMNIIENGGYVEVADGANVTFASNTLNDLILSSRIMTVHSNTTANNTKVTSGGEMNVYYGGIANDTTVNSNAYVNVSSGGAVNNTTISGGRIYVYSSGTADSTTVDSGGGIFISNGGIANITTVNSDGWIYTHGIINHTTAVGGRVDVDSDGIANSTTVNSDGDMLIRSGGTANSTIVNSGSYLGVDFGGTVNITTVNSRGGMYICGIANSTTVDSVGSMDVDAEGIANNTTVKFGGSMFISSGGTHKGILQIENGAIVSAYEGSIIDFTVAEQIEKDTCLINDLSLISGTPTYTITVSANQVSGTYKLAQGAANFSGSITIGDGTTNYGSITVNGYDFVYNDIGYSLDQVDGNLTLTVKDIIPPGMPEIFADITEITNKDVTVTATFAEDSVLNEYSFDGQKWFTYVDGVVFENNGKVYFRSTDASGNVSDSALYVVDNIVEYAELNGDSSHLSWSKKNPGTTFVSLSDGQKIFEFATEGTSLDMFGLETGIYSWQVRSEHSKAVDGNAFEVKSSAEPQRFVSSENGVTDLFIGRKNSVWLDKYKAVHNGFINGWTGTKESVSLAGKNNITDVFVGSNDANVLVLTDDANGDALFVEDIYSALSDQARFSQIDEIRAGAGDDIIDMTSQKFEYIGHGVKIYGGDGDDVIWANSGENILYGDAGNDRIVGGSGNDTIIGGIGNDHMHGGGGNDTFIFSGDFGNDVIEQLSGGSITLTFDSENVKWNELANAYTDGSNSVTINSDDCEVIVKYTSIA